MACRSLQFCIIWSTAWAALASQGHSRFALQTQAVHNHALRTEQRTDTIMLRPRPLTVNSGNFELSAATDVRTEPKLVAPSSLASQTDNDVSQWLVHLKYPLPARAVAVINEALSSWSLPDHLYQLGAYVPHNTYTLTAPEWVAARTRSLPHVRGVFAYKPSFRLDDERFSKIDLQSTDAGSVPTSHRLAALLVHTAANPRLEHAQAIAAQLNARWAQSTLSTDNDSEPEAEHAPRLLAAEPGASVTFHAVGTHRLAAECVGCSGRLLHATARWLTLHAQVHWVEPRARHQLLNYNAKFVVQSNNRNELSIFGRGLFGEGQVLSVSDTGVDFDLCFFADEQVPLQINTLMTTHRKFVYYHTEPGDLGGDKGEHGTHTAGTLAGNAFRSDAVTAMDTLSDYNGMAPAAKLAVYDFLPDSRTTIWIPDNALDVYYKHSYEVAGARISSNSWGDSEGDYDIWCYELDDFIASHPDYLFVFAAGNVGLDKAIHSPGVSKNVLTVGAVTNTASADPSRGFAHGVRFTAPDTLAGLGAIPVAPMVGSLPFHTAAPRTSSAALLPQPEDACAPVLACTASCDGAVVLVTLGNCTADVKYHNLIAAYPSAGLILFYGPDDAETPTLELKRSVWRASPLPIFAETTTALAIPAGSIQRKFGVALRSYISQPTQPLANFPIAIYNSGNPAINLASFSSRGPTKDGRRKPDVIAPGVVISANTDGDINTNPAASCSPLQTIMTKEMSGTSMATPVIAGNAALVRQYFTGGFYPGPTISNPSAALLKAMLIASAASITNQNPAPNDGKGYGRAQLDRILDFSASSASARSLFVFDVPEASGLLSLQSTSRCFSHNATYTAGQSTGHPFVATLVWTDPISSPSAIFLATNNLDLSVIPVSLDQNGRPRQVRVGNMAPGTTEIVWDTMNNVEQVFYPNEETSALSSVTTIFRVQVQGTHIPVGPQGYALVVSGSDLKELPVSECERAATVANTSLCLNGCSGHGVCTVSGSCVCDSNRAGVDCSIVPSSVALQGTTEVIEIAPPQTWKYYTFPVPQNCSSLRFRFTARPEQRGDPDLFINYPSTPGYPNMALFDRNETSCDLPPPECEQPASGPETRELVLDASALAVSSEAGPAVVRLSVYAYCCYEARYTLTAACADELGFPSDDTLTPSSAPTAAPVTIQPTSAPVTMQPTAAPLAMPTSAPTPLDPRLSCAGNLPLHYLFAPDILNILKARAVGLLGAPGYLNSNFRIDDVNASLATYNVLMAARSLQVSTMKLIEPGQPARSYLYHKLLGTHLTVGGTGARMPPGDPLPDSEIATFQAWICAGAMYGGVNESPAPTPICVNCPHPVPSDDGTGFVWIFNKISQLSPGAQVAVSLFIVIVSFVLIFLCCRLCCLQRRPNHVPLCCRCCPGCFKTYNPLDQAAGYDEGAFSLRSRTQPPTRGFRGNSSRFYPLENEVSMEHLVVDSPTARDTYTAPSPGPVPDVEQGATDVSNSLSSRSPLNASDMIARDNRDPNADWL